MFDVLIKIYTLLDRREKRNGLILGLMMILMGIFDAIGVASIMPFIKVAASPDAIDEIPILSLLKSISKIDSTDDFLVFLGLSSFLLIIGSLLFKSITFWLMHRFVQMRNYSLSSRLILKYTKNNYEWFLNRHSSDLGKNVLSEVQIVVNQIILPFAQLFSAIAVSFFMTALVVLVDPLSALAIGVVLVGFYICAYLALKGRMLVLGSKRVQANEQRFKVCQELFSGIKDIKILGLGDVYIARFEKAAKNLAKCQTVYSLMSQIPRFVLEGIVFGGLVLVLVFVIGFENTPIESLIPLIALYAFAAARLLPALQQVYMSVTKIRYGRAALDILVSDFITDPCDTDNTVNEMMRVIELRDSIKFNSVGFAYNNTRPLFKDFTIEIPANLTIGICGGSGAGKSTFVDLLLGLLDPTEGDIFLDNVRLSKKSRVAWQNSIGYVPQNIFITDGSIAENISISSPSVNIERVVESARLAGLADFIEQQLELGYDTRVGEDGLKLSGGQRQRLGIARALYKLPSVLVFDEATSSLDTATEKVVMDSVKKLHGLKTIILIAHRMSTLKDCDLIIVIDKGRVVGTGSFDELSAKNNYFRKLL
jgi:ABC-type multidrug transport system fused ATPase/permease subunit